MKLRTEIQGEVGGVIEKKPLNVEAVEDEFRIELPKGAKDFLILSASETREFLIRAKPNPKFQQQ